MNKLPVTPDELAALASDLRQLLDQINAIKKKVASVACDHCGGIALRYDNHFTAAQHTCSVCKGSGFKEADDE